MTDYEEEQKSEVEALESIYPEEFNVLRTTPFFSFTVAIKTPDYEDGDDGGFTYVAKYPDEPPIIEIAESVNVDESILEELGMYLNTLAQENLGMAMVFTLVSSAQEWLGVKTEELKQRLAEEAERKVKEAEEAERKKFEGTRVTVESFMAWKTTFDVEMALLKSKQQKDEIGSKRLTGRELFEKDHTLNESDIQFLQEGEEDIKVDESLFQDLDDLELDDLPADDS